MIQAALNAAQATSENANEAASQAAGELGAQTAMVGAARQRLHTLQEQLHGVRIDFEATQTAARKAQVRSLEYSKIVLSIINHKSTSLNTHYLYK